jgi:hypothetical protein
MATITHSTDAGRYGGSRPSDMVRNFIGIAGNMNAVDRLFTDRNVLVEMTYTPNAMDNAERQRLLGELLGFAQGQESWHGDWFLWNLVTVSDTEQNIRLTIA